MGRWRIIDRMVCMSEVASDERSDRSRGAEDRRAGHGWSWDVRGNGWCSTGQIKREEMKGDVGGEGKKENKEAQGAKKTGSKESGAKKENGHCGSDARVRAAHLF